MSYDNDLTFSGYPATDSASTQPGRCPIASKEFASAFRDNWVTGNGSALRTP